MRRGESRRSSSNRIYNGNLFPTPRARRVVESRSRADINRPIFCWRFANQPTVSKNVAWRETLFDCSNSPAVPQRYVYTEILRRLLLFRPSFFPFFSFFFSFFFFVQRPRVISCHFGFLPPQAGPPNVILIVDSRSCAIGSFPGATPVVLDGRSSRLSNLFFILPLSQTGEQFLFTPRKVAASRRSTTFLPINNRFLLAFTSTRAFVHAHTHTHTLMDIQTGTHDRRTVRALR